MVQTDSVKTQVLVICGPTASGKTSLAVKCAELLETEIISADALTVYKKLDIGTAKPSKDEMHNVLHHLIDVVSPTDTFSVGDYRELALPILKSIIKNGKIPIICGGTGFYINSLLYDLSYGETQGNLPVREKYFELAKEKGNDYVYSILNEIDPISAQKIHKNDLKRVIRALEIAETGQKKSDIKDDFTPVYNYKAFAIDYPREKLYNRINDRVDLMINGGLIDEVKSLLDSGVKTDSQSMQAIGYKEIIEYLDGKITLVDAIDKIKLNTRHYAKRQITFFKRYENLTLLEPQDVEIMAKKVVESL